ncbi:MAG: hypothetical protein JW782_04420 [Candidatus Saganbacteria bacterium]|nr:hypothetical protein [Candidatus Saganbacteria bacterium]
MAEQQETINQEFLEIARPLDLAVRKLLVPALFILALMAFHFGIPYPILPISIIFVLFLAVSSLCLWLIDRIPFPAHKIYFLLLAFDCLLLAVTTYYSGGPQSFVPAIYLVISTLAGLTLPLWGVIGITVIAGISYLGELLLEVNGILPHLDIFPEFLPAAQYAASSYLRITPLAYCLTFACIIFLSYAAAKQLRQHRSSQNLLSQELDQSTKAISQRDSRLFSLNQELEQKVHELEHFQYKLEEKVSSRTKELETAKQDLENKIKELKQFHDLAVGRELRMIALEKELKDLKKKVGSDAHGTD